MSGPDSTKSQRDEESQRSADVTDASRADRPAHAGGIARSNHFVPQGLQKRWSLNGRDLHTYSLLVPDERFPTWRRRPIKSLAKHQDLYTGIDGGEDSDATEKWFDGEIEQPGLAASERLIAGLRLTRDEWHAVIRLYALQEMRTPQSLIEQMRRWEASLPALLQDTLNNGISELRQAQTEGRPMPKVSVVDDAFDGVFKVEIQRSDAPAEGGMMRASVVVGRRLWIAGIRHVLEGRAMEALLRNHWAVLTPAPGYEWPLTDHPALRLGVWGSDKFTFAGGWGKRGTDLLMPLSPQHLLHSEVGQVRRGLYALSEDHTRAFRSFLLKRAHRRVFASRPMEWIPRERPRTVNREEFELEREAWSRWHDDQSHAERR